MRCKTKLLQLLLVLCMLSLLFGFSSCQNKNKPVETNEPPNNGEFDSVLTGADGYYIVTKRNESVTVSEDLVGVVDSKGNWVHPLSNEHVFKNGSNLNCANSPALVVDAAGKKTKQELDQMLIQSRIESVSKNIKYCGENMFSLIMAYSGGGSPVYALYNAKDNIGIDLGPCRQIKDFKDGYMVAVDSDGTIETINRDGTVKKLDLALRRGYVGQYSEGLFYANGAFYDLEGNQKIDLSEYAEQINGAPYFKNKKCYIEMKNPSGLLYETEIDASGAFLYEPRKKNS